MSNEPLPEDLQKLVNLDWPKYKAEHSKHPPIPNSKRAAQFTPFAALKGMDHIYTDTEKEHLEEVSRWDNRKY